MIFSLNGKKKCINVYTEKMIEKEEIMFEYYYVEDEQMKVVGSKIKEELILKMREHFTDERKNCVIPYEFVRDSKTVIDMAGLKELKNIFDFFRKNPEYKKEVSDYEARCLKKEF